MSDSLLTTYVTKLGETPGFGEKDYFLVSKLSSETDTSYVSQKISGKSIISAISSLADSAVEDKITKLSNAISANYDLIVELSARQIQCEIAVVKIANCLQQAKIDVESISNDVQTILSTLSGQSVWNDGTGVVLSGPTTLSGLATVSALAIGSTVLTESQLTSLLKLLENPTP